MHNFSKHYEFFVNELDTKRYRTYPIHELLKKKAYPLDHHKVHVGIRFDVDSGLELCEPLAEELAARKLKASFYFLTHPARYYNIWDSPVPRFVHEMGFEVGLHSDHYYEELMFGVKALPRIKQDIRRLSDMVGSKVRGVVAHGHPAIENSSEHIWDIYKNLEPQELDVEYHDETLENMIKYNAVISILDYLGIQNGWRYWPAYPKYALRRIPLGSIVFFMIHPHNFFLQNLSVNSPKDFWRNIYYFIRIRMRHQVVGTLIGEGKSPRQELKKLLKLNKERQYLG